MDVNDIRKKEFTGEARETIDFLLKELDWARYAAIGYGSLCIQTGICDEEECDDIRGWLEDAKSTGSALPPEVVDGLPSHWKRTIWDRVAEDED